MGSMSGSLNQAPDTHSYPRNPRYSSYPIISLCHHSP